jgi:putative endonuclease
MKAPLSPARTLKRPGEIKATVPVVADISQAVSKPAPRHPDAEPGAFVSVPSRRLKRPGEIATPEPVPTDEPTMTRHATGLSAESRAAAYLVSKGFRIVARRLRTPHGELDIVATRGRLIVFAEVKSRATTDSAAESLTKVQQQRIARAADLFLSKQKANLADLEIRFDVLLVAPGRAPVHVIDAFRVD